MSNWMGFGADEMGALRLQVAAERAEIARLYALPDRWLAEATLRMAREIRQKNPRFGAPDERGGYENGLLWHVVPELSRRLGCRMVPNEATDTRFVSASGQRLRDMVGAVIANVSSREILRDKDGGYLDIDRAPILCHDVQNGSPIAFMLDRIAPPSADSQDACARLMREVSAVRGHAPTPSWSPEVSRSAGGFSFLDFGKRAPDEEEGEAPGP